MAERKPTRTMQIGDYAMPQYTNPQTEANDLKSPTVVNPRKQSNVSPDDYDHKITHRDPGDD